MSITNQDYIRLLQGVQDYLATNFAGAVDGGAEQSVKTIIRRYLTEQGQAFGVRPDDEALCRRLYNDTAGYGCITDYLNRDDIEEININAFDSVYIHYTTGTTERLQQHFLSAEQAANAIKKLLRDQSKAVLDNAKPISFAHLNSDTRITAIHQSLLPENTGAAASIRFVQKAKQSRQTMLDGTATREMLLLLETLLRYGTSIAISGKTSSGKTNTAAYLLASLPDSCRIVSIEEGVREVDLVRRGDTRRPARNVVQLSTKDSEDEASAVTLADLFRVTLRLHPSCIFVGEMRSVEAWQAQEAARTDHAVITTIHARSSTAAYLRMVTLAKQAYDFSDDFLLKLMTEAFPIIVYQKQLEDGRRVIMQISECLGYEHSELKSQVLWQYTIDSNTMTADGKTEVRGHFEQKNRISTRLEEELRQNGCPDVILRAILKKEERGRSDDTLER